MRRREKFVLTSLLLSAAFVAIQYTPLEWRAFTIGGLGLLTYIFSSWALSDDLNRHERLTIVPFPALFAIALSWFYFLLPNAILTRLAIGGLFAVGIYASLLTSNIFSVAKGRTIQLLYAAHAVGLFFTLLTSLLFANTIFSLRLPFYLNGLLIGLTHFPLILMSLWSVNLAERVESELWLMSGSLTLLLAELAMIMSFLPLNLWHLALFVMSGLYLGLGVFQSILRERLFSQTMREYWLVAVFIVALFITFFPGK